MDRVAVEMAHPFLIIKRHSDTARFGIAAWDNLLLARKILNQAKNNHRNDYRVELGSVDDDGIFGVIGWVVPRFSNYNLLF